MHGAVVYEDCPVSAINVNSSKAIQSITVGDTKIYTNSLVLTAGAWSRDLVKTIGIDLPTMVNKHSYIVSDIIPGISSYPNVRHYDHNLYFKVQNDTIYMGAFEENPTFVEVDPNLVFGLYEFEWDVYMPYLNKHMETMPTLANVGQKTIICGPESFTPDYMAIFGQAPQVDGLFYNLGMSSRGIQLSGGMGREMANLIISRRTSVDMFQYDVNRFHQSYIGDQRWREEGVHEAEVRTYWVKYPTLQRMAGRNMYQSAFHEKLLKQGAFFGQAGGIERPIFFLKGTVDLSVPNYDWYGYYGHKRVHSTYEKIMTQEYARWEYSTRISEAIKNEVQACRENVALFDLSSFGKVMVEGEQALEALQWLCTAPMDNSIGSSKYTLMLNDSGGIEADITITRIEKDQFYLITGAAYTQYLLTHLKRKIGNKYPKANFKDVTHDYAILSLQGPESFEKLVKLCSSKEDQDALNSLEYGQSHLLKVKDCQVRVMRMSYVGELGYELHINKSEPTIQELFDALLNIDGMTLSGFEALNAMSMEKGHKHWHADIETVDYPNEAGLMFACKSPCEFEGKEKLGSKIASKRLAYFLVDPKIGLNGTEPIYRNGKSVGFLRRGGFAYTLNKSLGIGYVSLAEKENQTIKDFVLTGEYQIDVMGKMHGAKVSLQPVFDPKKSKMMKK